MTLPSHKAAFEGDIHSLRRLGEGGDKFDSLDEKGRLPIHLAAIGGHFQSVRFILTQNNGTAF